MTTRNNYKNIASDLFNLSRVSRDSHSHFYPSRSISHHLSVLIYETSLPTPINLMHITWHDDLSFITATLPPPFNMPRHLQNPSLLSHRPFVPLITLEQTVLAAWQGRSTMACSMQENFLVCLSAAGRAVRRTRYHEVDSTKR